MRFELDEECQRDAGHRVKEALERYNEEAGKLRELLLQKGDENTVACADSLRVAGQAYALLLEHMRYAENEYRKTQETLRKMGEKLG